MGTWRKSTWLGVGIVEVFLEVELGTARQGREGGGPGRSPWGGKLELGYSWSTDLDKGVQWKI